MIRLGGALQPEPSEILSGVLGASTAEIFQHHSQGLRVDLYGTRERMIDNDDNEQP